MSPSQFTPEDSTLPIPQFGSSASENDENSESNHREVASDATTADWNHRDNLENPRNFPSWQKWVMVSIVSCSSLCVTCTSALYSSTYNQITVQFHASELAVTVGLSLFIFGMGLGPMLVAPISEVTNSRPQQEILVPVSRIQ
ncbi:Ascochitine biosynthesis cluster MFS transporter [Cladobotryum mycophilum]|uniref:Ascochitine biosynthesis cluster MFS transporter n=1 Tax=Cladobotryum mycophilum TaxID=491253 RepID=A0ABR0SSM9_9HYPO